MKKLISLILMIVIISVLSVNVFATNSVLGNDNNNGTTIITGNEYENAQKNTQNNDTTLPQTGVEDFGLGILLVVFALSSVFAYKKVSDYKDI